MKYIFTTVTVYSCFLWENSITKLLHYLVRVQLTEVFQFLAQDHQQLHQL